MNTFLGFLILFVTLLLIIGIVIFIAAGIPYLIEKKQKRKTDLMKTNRLFRCKNEECTRLFRQYQINLYKAKHSEYKCPHCEKKLDAVNPYKTHHYSDTYYLVQQIDPWMDTHPDCPSLTKKTYKDVSKTFEVLRELKKQQEEQQRYEEYNKFELDFSWVNNLNKEVK